MDPIIPKPKPFTEEQFKLNTDRRIKGALGGFDRGEMVDLIQKDLRKIEESGTMDYNDALKFIKERTQELKEFLENNPGEEMPTLPGFEEEERVNFLDGGDTEYNSMVTKKYIELGGQEGTGMDIDKFAEEYFPKMANGGRINFDEGSPGKTDFNRNPAGANQFTGKMKSIEQIRQIQKDNPTFRPKDFRGEGTLNKPELGKENYKGKLLTRDDIKRGKAAGIVFPTGKIKFKDSRGNQNLKASQFYKSSQGSSISMDKINNFAHYAPKLKTFLTSTADTGPLKASVNRSAEGYDKAALKIAQKQETLLKEKPKNYKDLLIKENYKAANLSKKANKELPKGLKGTLGYFVVNPTTGNFTLKGVDRAKTFAGISGERREFKNMNPSERVAFGPTQSKVQGLIDLVKSKVKDSNPMRASNAPIPQKTKMNNLFKNFKIRIPGGSAGQMKDPLGGPDLIDVKKLDKNPYNDI